jgi:hypothetical protein
MPDLEDRNGAGVIIQGAHSLTRPHPLPDSPLTSLPPTQGFAATGEGEDGSPVVDQDLWKQWLQTGYERDHTAPGWDPDRRPDLPLGLTPTRPIAAGVGWACGHPVQDIRYGRVR